MTLRRATKVNNAFKSPVSNDPEAGWRIPWCFDEVDRLLKGGAKFFELPLSVWDDVQNVGLKSHYAAWLDLLYGRRAQVASYYAAPLLLSAARAKPERFRAFGIGFSREATPDLRHLLVWRSHLPLHHRLWGWQDRHGSAHAGSAGGARAAGGGLRVALAGHRPD